ncbi:MAG: hypothetical protein NTU47_13505 [Ignavibacteriales bacterium]|nr:hypothetical protein [Ignavibacteriales bacterium]
MKRIVFLLACTTFLLHAASSQAQYTTSEFRLNVDQTGRVTSLFDIVHQQEYLAAKQPSPFLTIRMGKRVEEPSAVRSISQNVFNVRFGRSGASVDVKVVSYRTHLSFEVIRATPVDSIDAIIWGPFPTSITRTVGEIVGVVRDDRFAIGIQALNPKTIGSYPDNAEGFDMSRGRAAEPRPWGSVLQCYSLNRAKPRKADVWLGNFPNMPIDPLQGETVVGSKIALFGCPEPSALDRIGEIEIAEGLPHPMIDGVWFKKSPEQGRSYLIADFDEQTIDELLACTKRGGLMTLYHMEPFASWGHYEVSTKVFPSGAAGLRRCVDKAKALGIRLGAHTLTTFIQTHDPYVTPIPDPRLAKTGSSLLTSTIDTAANEIPVASPEYFANEKANWLHAVVIDQEIIRYRAVSSQSPWILIDCQRGAFGTKRSAHTKGAEVGKLLDHPYQVFFPKMDLQGEIARNLAKTFNLTGLGQMDFDGHEGCASTGQGDYAYGLFPKDFYDNLDHTVINGTSNSKHFYWHINSYCNWGEPWYEGFRESMQEYRINNQALFERNYLPNMLGWYLLTETTSLSDIEWMLARAAGFNAGFALATGIDAVRKNPDTGIILDAIREWESARRQGAFSAAQRGLLKNPRNEFHLESIGGGQWKLYAYHESQGFRHERVFRQPGEPTSSRWEFQNPDQKQSLQFKLRVVGDSGIVANPTIELDRTVAMMFPVELTYGQTLLCEGTSTARVYDAKGRQIRTVHATAPVPTVQTGKHEIQFSCDFKGSVSAGVLVTFKTRGDAVEVGGK